MTVGDQKAETEENFTVEQLESIKRIIQKQGSNYYAILGLQLFSREEEVRRAYKQLSLQLHPDRNKAPRAEEAFKVMQNAYFVLNDSEKKDRHDTELRQQQQRANSQHKETHDDPFEGRPRPSSTPPQYRYPTPRSGGYTFSMNDGFKNFPWMLVIPILLLLLYPIVSSIFQIDEPFALRKRGPFTELRFTSIRRIPYFVKKGFRTDNLKEFHDIEDRVEKKYNRFYS